jgi:hypothetical protein
MPNSGVMWGRPFGRTVDSQYTSASRSSARPRDHAVGSASVLLKALRVVIGSDSFIIVPSCLIVWPSASVPFGGITLPRSR